MNMESVSTVQTSLFLNTDATAKQKSLLKHSGEQASDKQPLLKHELLKTGSQQTMADAEAIFERANSYADVSAKVQKSLQAYAAVEISLKREAVSQLMGVDLFA